jgi:basic membrane protein A
MLRRRLAFVALLAAFALIIAACGSDTGETTTTAAPGTSVTTTAPPQTTTVPETTTTTAAPVAKKVCQVSDTGGIDDKSFNQTAWKGAEDAKAQLGVEIAFLESQGLSDFRPNIDSFIAEGCDLIITVGFLLANDTGAAALANPDQKFAIVDYAVGDFPPWCAGEADPGVDGTLGTFDDTCGGNIVQNVRGLTYATDEAAFLAGYLAAGMTASGTVGTYGGMNIPTVTIFMNGFANGVAYYNAQKTADVKVIGWDPATSEGLFTGNFESLEDGRVMAQTLTDEGADIILAVAGGVGEGSAALCAELGSCSMIGVDADQYFIIDAYKQLYMTSVTKGMDVSVFNTIQNVLTLGALGNQYVGTLANGGVGLAPYHDFESKVPAELAAEVEALKAEIIAGNVSVSGA